MLKIISFITALFFPTVAFAQTIEYHITTPIPGISGGATADLGSYIAAIFRFGLSIVGLVAFGALVYYGVRYIIGAGNESFVGEAKKGIYDVITGVILLFASVVILDTINPCILQSVNVWRDRASIQEQCGVGTGLVRPLSPPNNSIVHDPAREATLNQLAVDNMLANGPIITNQSGRLEITGINGENFQKVIVNPNGSYEVFQLDSGVYRSTNPPTRGDNINSLISPSAPNLLTPFSPTQQSAAENQLREFLINGSRSESSYATINSNNMGYIVSPSNNGNFTIDYQSENFMGRPVTVTGECNQITTSSAQSYYRCGDININNGQSFHADVIYLEQIPDINTQNESYKILRGSLIRQTRP